MTKKYHKSQSSMKKFPNQWFRSNRSLWLTAILASLMVLVSGNVYAQISARMVPIITYLLDEIENKLKAIPTNKLNDTGITKGLSIGASAFSSVCDADTAGPQDCNYGNDLRPGNQVFSPGGFNFTFVDDNGLAQQPQDFETSCAFLDNVTGLMWDSGRPVTGLRGFDSTFTWFDSELIPSLEDVALANTCPGFNFGLSETYCNTEAYLARLNASQLCGHADWRLPTVNELQGVLNYDDDLNSDNPSSPAGNNDFWTSTLWVLNDQLIYGDIIFVNSVDFGRATSGARASDEAALIVVVRND